MNKPVIRTPYNDPYEDKGLQCVTLDGEAEPLLTIQSEIDNCDINILVERFAKSGVIPNGNAGTPTYGDFSELPSYQESLNVVLSAQNAFMSLDAKIRKEFDNDPGKFLAFVDDPANADALIKMGLREAPPPAPTPPKGDEKEAT